VTGERGWGYIRLGVVCYKVKAEAGKGLITKSKRGVCTEGGGTVGALISLGSIPVDSRGQGLATEPKKQVSATDFTVSRELSVFGEAPPTIGFIMGYSSATEGRRELEDVTGERGWKDLGLGVVCFVIGSGAGKKLF
jgi:hypothetical protein